MTLVTNHESPTSGETGAPPGDRPFRPDVQGLRAIAILLVVLFHAGVPGITGGYVGVDVFFVISGFVITGLLLRERSRSRRLSLLNFYGRRARRIIPAASLVLVVTVVAAFFYLGSITGHQTAIDGQWAALFLANLHFAASQTNYLASQRPPSALQNYWSLAVEEQFYIVYPLVFLVVMRLRVRISVRKRLAALLVIVIVSSFTYSIVFTSINAPSAFFSPLTRAWEFALGGILSLLSNDLRRIPKSIASLMTWVGLAAIVTASLAFTSASVYPGALVAIPVLGTGLIIAGGSAEPDWGVESLLRKRPFQLLALISYSLYLWHWPILIIATQHRGASILPVWENILWLLVATAAAIMTYRVLENPVRHSPFLAGRQWASVTMGALLIAVSLAVATFEQARPAVDLGVLAAATPGSICHSPSPGMVSILRARYGSSEGRVESAPGQFQTVLVIGDSTACTLLPGLEAVGQSYRLHFVNGAVIGCGIVSGELPPSPYASTSYTKLCQGQADNAELKAVERYRPSIVVWASTQEHYSIVVNAATRSKVLESGSPEWRSVLRHRIELRVQQFVSTGAKVILVLEPAEVHAGSKTTPNSTDVAYEQMNALLTDVAVSDPRHVGLVNLQTRVCPSGPPCPYVVEAFGSRQTTPAQTLRPDDLHYLPAGSLWVARWFVPQIRAEANRLS